MLKHCIQSPYFCLIRISDSAQQEFKQDLKKYAFVFSKPQACSCHMRTKTDKQTTYAGLITYPEFVVLFSYQVRS